jgi:hypothetical protein
VVDNVGAYIGTWFVGMTGSPSGLLQPGCQLVIGTGEYGATPPFLTEGYKTAVGFAVLDPDGTPVLGTGDSENDPLLFLFVNGSLRYAGYYKRQPLRIYISMAEALMPTVGTTGGEPAAKPGARLRAC